MSVQTSVIVCTYNRAEILKGALSSLLQQSLDSDKYEIIVVNNASTDKTPELIREYQEKHPKYHIVEVYESEQGLGHARNAGFDHARGCFVAYMDDDARADADWLRIALDIFKSIEPTPICLGGEIKPFYTSSKPKWFKDEYEIRTWGDKPRFLQPGESFSGSNMVWRKSYLEAWSGFEVKLGVRGSYLSVGEETALFNEAWKSNDYPVFYYDPKLLVHHWVPAHKMTVWYRMKWAFAVGQASSKLYSPSGLWRRIWFLLIRLIGVGKTLFRAFRRSRNKGSWQNWFIEEWESVARNLGSLFGGLGLFLPIKQR